MTNIKTIAICGAGTMGAGVALVFAQHQFDVMLYDINDAALQRGKGEIIRNMDAAIAKGKATAAERAAVLAAINFTTDLHALKADLVIEAVVEKLEVKRQLFSKLAAINSAETILASNTSSLSITEIANGISNPARVAGLHFFNPAHLMKLVEVISWAETSADVVTTLKELVLKIGKNPVLCSDSPGFIVNRVARHYYVESLKVLGERVASMENIDALLESAGFKMGPFKLMDTIGNDVNFAVTSSLYKAFHQDAKFRPSRIQEQKVKAGHLGKKSGKGFYDYSKA